MKSMINYVKHAVAGSSKLKATTAGHIYSVRVGSKDLDKARARIIEITKEVG